MPERWPDQTLNQAFGLPEGAGRRPHLASVFQRNRKSPNIHTSSGVIWGMSASTAGRIKGRPDAGAVEETVKLTLEAATQTSAPYACSKRKADAS